MIELSDDDGPIPRFPPIATDEQGRIVPMSDELWDDRAKAMMRVLRMATRVMDDEDEGTTPMTTLYKPCPACGELEYGMPDCVICHGRHFVEHGQVLECVDHPGLDEIFHAMKARFLNYLDVSRESECVEFTDPETGKRYEVVVREIDGEEPDLDDGDPIGR